MAVKPRIVYRSGVDKPLTFEEYDAILKRAATNRNLICTNCPLYRPEGGTIVVYDCKVYPRGNMTDTQLRQTFRVDGYRWGHSKGVHLLKNGLEKRYYCLYERGNKRGDFSFMRSEYSREPCGLVLFHYIGDHIKGSFVSDNSPHGNAKKTIEPYYRTLPIVLQEIKDKSVEIASPIEIFHDIQQHGISGSAHIVQRQVRNREQVRNVLKNAKKDHSGLSSISDESVARNVRYVRRAVSSGPSVSGGVKDVKGDEASSSVNYRPSLHPPEEISVFDSSCIPEYKRVRKFEEVEGGKGEEGDGGMDGEGSVITKKPRVDEADMASETSSISVDVTNVEGKTKIVRRAPFDSQHSFARQGGKFHLLIGITGSVATIKLNELIAELQRLSPPNKLVIRIVTTEAAKHFIVEEELSQPAYDDNDEWNMWKKRGDPVLHIELRKWADAMLIAPLDANSMAKIANGLCDNLLTSVVRAWDPRKPLYFAPAMNSAMWDNPLTYQHRKTLKELLRYKEIPPIEKELMCGDKGYGAMATVQMIASIVSSEVKNRFAVYSDSSQP